MVEVINAYSVYYYVHTLGAAGAVGDGVEVKVEVDGGCADENGVGEGGGANVSRLCEDFLTTPSSRTMADCVHFLQELDNTRAIAESR